MSGSQILWRRIPLRGDGARRMGVAGPKYRSALSAPRQNVRVRRRRDDPRHAAGSAEPVWEGDLEIETGAWDGQAGGGGAVLKPVPRSLTTKLGLALLVGCGDRRERQPCAFRRAANA
jgi:hypothetical protein